MISKELPAWRSLLFCPADNNRFISKLATRGADAVILDLEDSVAESQKEYARNNIEQAAVKLKDKLDVCVRINREIDIAIKDIQASVSNSVYALFVPKVHGPEHLQLLDEFITKCEAEAGVALGETKIIAAIETAAATLKANEIATSSTRLIALVVGGEDLATDIDAKPNLDSLFTAKMISVYAARASGILPMGMLTSVASISDDTEYERLIERSRDAGFACATCVHPNHISIINKIFTPQEDEYNKAKSIIQSFNQGKSEGRGAVNFEGMMVDRPVYERALRLVARFERSA